MAIKEKRKQVKGRGITKKRTLTVSPSEEKSNARARLTERAPEKLDGKLTDLQSGPGLS